MNTISPTAAVRQHLAPQRSRPYRHRVGAFTLTANFRDADIDDAKIEMVAALVGSFTQVNVARILNCGVSTVSKCVRIVAARKLAGEK